MILAMEGPGIIEPLDRGDAERLDKRIRLMAGQIAENMTKLYELTERAKSGKIHVALGFPSWTAYLADAVTVQVRLEREQRRELVGYLSGEGVPNTVIADMAGVDEKTVRNDRRAISENSDIEGPPVRVTRRDGKTYKRNEGPRPYKGRGNEKKQLNASKGITSTISGVATALEAAFAGGYEKSFTADIANDFTSTARRDLARIDKIIGQIQQYGSATKSPRPGVTTYSIAIQRLSSSLAEGCDTLTDDEVAEALGAAQFLYELLRGETVQRGGRAPERTTLPALEKWDESAWDAEKINESPRVVKMYHVMCDTLDSLTGTEGEMLARIGQSILDFLDDGNKARGMARMMHSVIEFASEYNAARRRVLMPTG